MFGSFSSRPDAGKKTSSRGQGVTPRILSNSRDSKIKSTRSISESSQKTGKYTYPTPGPPHKNPTLPPPAIPRQQSGLEKHSRHMYPPPKDPAGTLEDENYGSPYPPQNAGTCEYYISSTRYVTKYLLAHPFHTQYIPQPQPFRYSETSFYYRGDTPEPSIEGNEMSATQKIISIEGTPREQSTTSRGAEDNGVPISRGGRKGKPTGKHISDDDEMQLFRICKKHKTSYGHKGERQ